MYHFFDPSIKPTTITDLYGNVIYIRTFGLNSYGLPDLIMDPNINNFEEIFYSIINRMFSLDFEINDTWSLDGKSFKLELISESLAKITFPTIEETRIITLFNLNGEPIKYLTKGLEDLYDHPEIEMNHHEAKYSKEILAYIIDQIIKGAAYDEDCYISYENLVYTISNSIDRWGKKKLIISMEPEINQSYKDTPKAKLKRIK
ncbi:hypothetical protein QYF50_06605 [Paenibacillus vini]|uniref:hypothetical protein n=1 Tax=Paenibacillus vini TaxID=1476024 RepID=UPI0025B6FA51|nr:hypothetical protein [Paenibacillus vini]MDN4067562.1 hypothetical protein [Paenibacillus vini]